MTRPVGFEIPDSRYPTLFLGSRVTKSDRPELSGKVIRYLTGCGSRSPRGESVHVSVVAGFEKAAG